MLLPLRTSSTHTASNRPISFHIGPPLDELERARLREALAVRDISHGIGVTAGRMCGAVAAHLHGKDAIAARTQRLSGCQRELIGQRGGSAAAALLNLPADGVVLTAGVAAGRTLHHHRD